MIKCAENTIKVERCCIQGKKKNLPTTLNCFLILEKPKEKKQMYFKYFKIINQQINKSYEKLHFRLHCSLGLKRMYIPKQ